MWDKVIAQIEDKIAPEKMSVREALEALEELSEWIEVSIAALQDDLSGDE